MTAAIGAGPVQFPMPVQSDWTGDDVQDPRPSGSMSPGERVVLTPILRDALPVHPQVVAGQRDFLEIRRREFAD